MDDKYLTFGKQNLDNKVTIYVPGRKHDSIVDD